MKENKEIFTTFEEFYPFYLSQHSNRINRRLHVIGTLLAAIQIIRCILVSFDLISLIMAPIIGYGMAWIGHFFF